MSGWKLSALADADLVDMYRYGLSTFGERQAESYRLEITYILDLLATFPRMAPERGEFQPPVRVHHHGRHYILYSVQEDHILIVRIVHDDADLDLLFEPF